MADVRVLPFLVSELRLPPDEQATLRSGEWWPSYAHAVVHPDGVFLFDNGAGSGNAEVERPSRRALRPIEDASPRHGISIADVTGAANCHLHFDHSGQNARLPGVFRSSSSAPSGRWCTSPTTRCPSGSTPRTWPTRCSTARRRGRARAPARPDARAHAGSPVARASTPPRAPSCSPARRCSRAPSGTARRAETDSGRPDAAGPEATTRSVARLRALDPVRVHFAHDAASGTADPSVSRARDGSSPFVHLDVRSCFSLKEGAFTPGAARRRGGGARDAGGGDDRPRRALRRRAVRPGVPAARRAADPRRVAHGAGARAAAGRRARRAAALDERPGYANLCRLLTDAHLLGERGDPWVAAEQICAHAAGMTALLGPRSHAGRLAAAGRTDAAARARGAVPRGVRRRPAASSRWSIGSRRAPTPRSARCSGSPSGSRSPRSRTNPVRYLVPEDAFLADALECMRRIVPIASNHVTRANAEGWLKPADAMRALFAERPDLCRRARSRSPSGVTFDLGLKRAALPRLPHAGRPQRRRAARRAVLARRARAGHARGRARCATASTWSSR